ncbi:metallophosphoesterase [Acidianus sp. HS-5]|uniref:metallophosphoesterase family protein n=1 Tax=Acidianus sp. HS-5 TaxID=2886040 RepID=UPI001F43253C|nr:metallophosphoesterase [Acidianus sp. HS-5]BDC18437.1 phosphoesterase [Acidianus sp. HS-5]
MAGEIKLMFVTDLHGSEIAYRKALNAAKMYNVDYLIIGGDVTSKNIAFIERIDDKYYINGNEVDIKTVYEEAKKYGYYVHVACKEEIRKIEESKEYYESVKKTLVEKQIDNWIKIAEEKLTGSHIKIFWSYGNDDPLYLDEIFSKYNIRDEGIFELEEGRANFLYLISYGYVNPTPFKSYREELDSTIYIKGEDYLKKIDDPTRVILNFHAPPYNTKLDIAIVNGKKREHVGSRGVRDLIERYKPLLGLHGHIVESPATDKIKNTIIVNPGSLAHEGTLKYSVIVIERKLEGLLIKYKIKGTAILSG